MPVKKSVRRIKKKQVIKHKIHKKPTTTNPVLHSLPNPLNPNGMLPNDPYSNPIRPGTSARELLMSRVMGGIGGAPLQTVGNLTNERRLEDIRVDKQREENLHKVIREEIKKENQELKEARKKRKEAEHEKEKQELKLDDAKYDKNRAELLENKAESIKKRINDLNKEKEMIKTDFSIAEGKALINEQNALIAEEKIRLEEVERKLEGDEAAKNANVLSKRLELMKAETEAKKQILEKVSYTDTIKAHKDNYIELLKSEFENKLLDELIKKKEENALNDFRNNSSLTLDDYNKIAQGHYEGYKNAELLAAQYRDKAHENQILKSKWENLLDKHKQAELKVQDVELENDALASQIENITVEKEKYIDGEMKNTLNSLAKQNVTAEKQKRIIENRKRTRKIMEEAHIAEQELTHLPKELTDAELEDLNEAAEKRAAINNSKRRISYRNALFEQNRINAETSAEFNNVQTELNSDETELLNKTAAKKVLTEEMIRKMERKKQLLNENIITAEAKAGYDAQKEGVDEEEMNLISNEELSKSSTANYNNLKAQKEENRKAALLNAKTVANYNSTPNGASEQELELAKQTAEISARTGLVNKLIAASELKSKADVDLEETVARNNYVNTEEAKVLYDKIYEEKKLAALSEEKTRVESLLAASRKNAYDQLLARNIHKAVFEADGASAEENLAIQFNALAESESKLRSDEKTNLFNKLSSLSSNNPYLWKLFCEANPPVANLSSENYLSYDTIILRNYVDLFIKFMNDNPDYREK